ncbi:MAG: hypothetical protein DMG50_29220, partial [Acidobacteria bacterium]
HPCGMQRIPLSSAIQAILRSSLMPPTFVTSGCTISKAPPWSHGCGSSSRIKIKRLERYHSTCYLRGALQLRSNHGYPCLCSGGLPALPFSATSQTRPGSRRSSPATRRLQAEAAPAQIGSPRSAVLDCPPPAVGELVGSPDHRQAGDRGFLASCRIPAVLAVAVSATSTGSTTGECADPPVNSTHEGGNPTWGAPRIHGELLQLGCEISEPTVSRYLHNLNGCRDEGRAKRWLAFLNNHREVIAAFDFLTVPSLTFRTLYCFFVIEHGRRRILHFNVTEHPASDWIVQQLREALPLPCPYRYVLFDRDTKFGGDVVEFLHASSMKPIRTSVRSLWQNGVAERWVGSLRREVLDHVIPLNDQHLRRLGREYIAYYQEDRTHIGLEKTTPAGRPVEPRPTEPRQPRALPRIGGLHHRYTWPTAA